MLGKTEQVYKNGLACIDTSTGLVAKGFASTTLIPIGFYMQDQLTAAGGTVEVLLFNEITAAYYANSTSTDLIAVAQIGSNAFVVDDQTVAKTSATNTRSVAGFIWGVDAVKGVLVAINGLM